LAEYVCAQLQFFVAVKVSRSNFGIYIHRGFQTYIDHDDKDVVTSHLISGQMIGGTVTSSKNQTAISVISVFSRKHTAGLLLSIRKYKYIIHELRKSVTRYIHRSHLDRPSSLGGRVNLPLLTHQLFSLEPSNVLEAGGNNTNNS
jgi:hypothetical protein